MPWVLGVGAMGTGRKRCAPRSCGPWSPLGWLNGAPGGVLAGSCLELPSPVAVALMPGPFPPAAPFLGRDALCGAEGRGGVCAEASGILQSEPHRDHPAAGGERSQQ